MPPSSVGTRPQFLAYAENAILRKLRDQYNERGVSTGRPRDIFRYSLPEFARAMALMIGDVAFPRDRVVTVFNRVDGIPDFAQLEPEGLTVTTGWKFRQGVENILVGNVTRDPITPESVLENYPDRETMGSEAVFGADCRDLFLQRVLGEIHSSQTPTSVSSGVKRLLGMILASMSNRDKIPEVILGFGP